MYADLPQNHTITFDLSMPHHKQSVKLNSLPSNTSDVIQRFAAYTFRNRIRIRDFFSFQIRLTLEK